MIKRVKKRSKKVGLPPGTLLFTGEKKVEIEKIKVIDFNEKQLEVNEYKEVKRDLFNKDEGMVRWINLDGLSRVDLVENIGKQFDIHPLILEDIMNPVQRPKIEDLNNYFFIVLNMLYLDEETELIQSEQISLILGSTYVITFREQESKIFDSIIKRIETSRGRIRAEKSDYLGYAILDVILDNYFVIQEKIGEKIDLIEEELLENPSSELLGKIHHIEREVITLRRIIRPLREVINSFQREDNPIIHDTTRLYLRDLYDHIIQIIDTFENFRDIITTLHESYLSRINQRMNEIINLLTIISSIFIPLSFLAGFYGMNFIYMPEVRHPMGYPIIIMVMISIAVLMLLYFKKKKWICLKKK
ncbi:MAG: magnesium/cobalt transporter CorA [Promethearchaeota archaeon]|nr:MAG: magnesium/cobalt transporter CorA [Candidatus Lokiarchaeota archaeon]